MRNSSSPTHVSNSQPSTPSRRHLQVSLGVLLLLMVVFSVISAGLLYASKVPEVQEEISVLTGGTVQPTSGSGRASHLVFIMFTLTSPLLLAGILSSAVAVLRWFRNHT
ncbi:MAG: hypothetical protein AAF958_02440 [Planctomycetota bacterium]